MSVLIIYSNKRYDIKKDWNQFPKSSQNMDEYLSFAEDIEEIGIVTWLVLKRGIVLRKNKSIVQTWPRDLAALEMQEKINSLCLGFDLSRVTFSKL